jgi:hypothetical protein
MTEDSPDVPDRPPVLVQTRYDRFPATLKGAFVLRGGDVNPHLARLLRAAIDLVPEGQAKEIAMGDIRVDVAPGKDLYVPFEVGITDLSPGWFVIASDIQVDGGAVMASASRPFSVPWPRGEVRTGSTPVETTTSVGGRTVRIERIELKMDRTIVVWREEDALESETTIHAEVAAPGGALAAVPDAVQEGRLGERRSIFYPASRDVNLLALSFALDSGERSDPVEARLS